MRHSRSRGRLAIAVAATLAACSSSPTDENALPQVSITSPSNDAVFQLGSTISFGGSGNDADDGALTGPSLVWNSTLDGEIGTGASFSRADLSAGDHTVTLTGTDADGETGNHSVGITINAPPHAVIGAPTNDAQFDEGQSVAFSGSATDPEDGTLGGFALVWTSSLDGQIGTGGSFSRSDLSDGDHTITLTATDPDGGTDSTTIDLTIHDLPGDPPVTFSTWILPIAYPGVAYAATIQASGGIGTFTYALLQGSLPPGMSLSPTTGAITGSSTDAGVHHFMVGVTSGLSTDTRVLSITVSTAVAGAFNLHVANVTDLIPSLAVRTALDDAVAKWEAVIVGDLEGIVMPLLDDESCGGHGAKVPQGTAVDDLLVLAEIGPIDGPGQVLGRAGPCGFLTFDSPPLPTAGSLVLDDVDLGGLNAVQLRALVFHEVGHIVGIGPLWNFERALLTGHDPAGTNTSADPRFVGSAATAAYNAMGGPQANVAVENQGGPGTANSHWRETVFDHEVMTGFLENSLAPSQPVSTLTIGSLGDLGYVVNMGAADPFTLPGGGGLRLEGGEPTGIPFGNDVVFEPLYLLAPDGSVRTVNPLDRVEPFR